MAFKPYCIDCKSWHTDAEGHIQKPAIETIHDKIWLRLVAHNWGELQQYRDVILSHVEPILRAVMNENVNNSK